MDSIETIMRLAPVIPVLVLDDCASAMPMAEALVAGGLPVIEVTLRTPNSLEVIRAITTVEGAVVGAGTVSEPGQLEAALHYAARFIVPPGPAKESGAAALVASAPLLPLIANCADIMLGLSLGFRHFKNFPAVAWGGVPTLRALASVFGDVSFCLTGGIPEATAGSRLATDAVHCVGGSRVVPKGGIDTAVIEATVRRVAVPRHRTELLPRSETQL